MPSFAFLFFALQTIKGRLVLFTIMKTSSLTCKSVFIKLTLMKTPAAHSRGLDQEIKREHSFFKPESEQYSQPPPSFQE